METRFETLKEFTPVWESLKPGEKAWKVKTFDGNTGNCVGIEYTIDPDKDLEDMKEVSDGYFVETWVLTKKLK